ncbi:BACON domain-containing protein [Porphyromonas sp.]|uniref:BACON domain-containing protein n=1 Tax=Porphyromonas sp. TaxID=1924944 RepID=UPI003995F740
MRRNIILLPLLALLLWSCEEGSQPNDQKTTFAPIVESVSAADSQTGKPISDSHSFTTSEDKLTIQVSTTDPFALLLGVSTQDAQATASIVTGADWIKVREIDPSKEAQHFLVTLAANANDAGRVGVIVLSNSKDSKQKTFVTIHQRGSVQQGGDGEYAPTIVAVTGINPMTDQPLERPRHVTEAPFTSIRLETYDTYALLLEVLGSSAPAQGKVVQGDEWLTLLDNTSDKSAKTRFFKLHIQQNTSPNPRVGAIELYNSKAPDQKILVEIRQIAKKALHEPDNERDRLVLNYVAEWNVDTLGNFITTHNNIENQKGLFSFMAARGLFATPLTIEETTYILPSAMQWFAIVPVDGVYSRANDLKLELPETCMVGGRVIETLGSYLNVKETHTTYAIRFIGDKEQQSVWRYVYKDNPAGSGKILMIQERHMSQDSNWTLEGIANDTFWEKDKDQIVTRFFSTPGYAVGNFYTHSPNYNDIELVGEVGIYWSSTPAGEEQSWAMEVLDPQVRTRDFYGNIDGQNVRPFRQSLMQ